MNPWIALLIGLILLWFGLPTLTKQKIKYRGRYWIHKTIGFFGYCADCKEKLNISEKTGSGFCPNCKKRKW